MRVPNLGLDILNMKLWSIDIRSLTSCHSGTSVYLGTFLTNAPFGTLQSALQNAGAVLMGDQSSLETRGKANTSTSLPVIRNNDGLLLHTSTELHHPDVGLHNKPNVVPSLEH